VIEGRYRQPAQWIEQRVGRCWPGARAKEITPLKGDASTRRFWRIAITPARRIRGRDIPATAIAVDLGPEDLPLYVRTLGLMPEPPTEPPWVSMQSFLYKLDIAVPELYEADHEARMLLVEDVGELPLFEAAQRGDAGDLYRLAVNELLRIHLEGTKRLGPGCVAAHIAYDQKLFRWELEQFTELGMAQIAPGADRDAIAPELDDLAARLGCLPRVLSHRDYHGHNLYVQIDRSDEPRIRVIDFQDALMAPAAQDLAVLLTTRDTSRVISARLEQGLLEYYYAALARREAPLPTYTEFLESYRLCVLQHALKVIGRFTYLERNGKTGYSIYIPPTLEQARRILAQTAGFPVLRGVLCG
jgi:aminoglycoside/choline kinase family phosphotransferase